MNNLFNGYINQILLVLLLALAAFLGTQVKNLYARYVNTEVKQAVCRTAVRFVEQVYKDLHGEAKLNEALVAASGMLAEKGIKVSDLEMRVLIEAAVAEFNEAFKKSE